jgi:hypothetical protein
MDKKLEALIEQGSGFSFENNSYYSQYDNIRYSKASSEFLAWVAGVEHFVIQNYDDDSGPVKLFMTLDRRKISGDYQSAFEKQLHILRGVLISCKGIPPSKRKKQETSQILNLVNNHLFWTATLILTGGAFTLGMYFGINKFDSNLIELSQDKKSLQDSLKIKNNLIQTIRHNSDSALNILGHMPYTEMKLDTLSFRKVQTTIENAGAVLYLNK